MSEHSPSTRPCPICGKPQEQRFRPFCSKRCANLDLAHWLKGDYAVAARETPEGEDEDEGGREETGEE